MDSDSGSVTHFLVRLKAGDQQAVQPLWDRYFSRLAGRAGRKLRAVGHPRTAVDEEDIALSTFAAFSRGVQAGRFPDLSGRAELWKILAHLSLCKTIDECRRWLRKHGGPRVRPEADLGSRADSPGEGAFSVLVAPGPAPDSRVSAAEEYRRRVESLGDPSLRRIAELKLERWTNREIAERCGCSLRTVTLKLREIRERWASGSPESAGR